MKRDVVLNRWKVVNSGIHKVRFVQFTIYQLDIPGSLNIDSISTHNTRITTKNDQNSIMNINNGVPQTVFKSN